MYKKRAGTSGISGQLYETRLLSLILFRLLHDDSVTKFDLGSNMDEIGAFDDACFRVEIKGFKKPLLIFIQAKHKETNDTFLKYDLIKHFHESFLAIKDNFIANSSALFKGKLEDVDCLFILYTNAKFYIDSNATEAELAAYNKISTIKQVRKSYKSDFAEKLSRLIGTGEDKNHGSQTEYTDKDLEHASEKILEEELTTLAERFSKFLNDQSLNIMLDKYVLLYHVILARSVVNISDILSEEIIPKKKEKVKKCGQKPGQNHNNKSKQPEKTKPEEEQTGKKPDEKTKQNVEIRRYRELTFRAEFFTTDDKKLSIFRNKLYEIIINNQVRNKKKLNTTQNDEPSTSSTADTTNTTESNVEKQIEDFLSKPTPTTLSPLIGTYIVFKTEDLKFTVDRPESDEDKLLQINASIDNLPLMVDEAEKIAARDYLLSLKLKVPITFGNIDLAIAGDSKKIGKRIDILMDFIVKLCQKSTDISNIKIEKSDGEGFLSLTNGIGSAVGNLLVYDNTTKCLKFYDSTPELASSDCPPLGANSQELFNKLKNNPSIATNFKSYRFNTKAMNDFPKLLLDFSDESRAILDKVVVYDKQSNYEGVARLLKNEIEKYHRYTDSPSKILEQSDDVAMYYHNEIQKMWMTPKIGKFITKQSDIYKNIIKNLFSDSQISALQTAFNLNNMKNFKYDFNERAIEVIALIEFYSRTIIVSDIPILSAIKVIQFLKSKYIDNYVVLDLGRMINLPNEDFSTLIFELSKTNKILIILCDKPRNNRVLHKRLDALAEPTADKKVIVITDNTFQETVKEYFDRVDVVLDDEGLGLLDLTLDAAIDVVLDIEVIFQGEKVDLVYLVDRQNAAFLRGAVLNKIVHNETVVIGTPLSNPQYEKMQHLYVERKVHLAESNLNDELYDDITDLSKRKPKPKGQLVTTFEDIDDDVVLITAAPGMGKSTLLTRLSVKSKEETNELWIVRINLLDHSKTFFDWQTYHVDIDVRETLKIMCQVILGNSNHDIRLKKLFDKIYLGDSTGDEETDFILNMFLHFFNERKLLFLFDGFDEICPHYKDKVISLLKVVMNDYPKRHKMWVTSRPYSEILPDLQNVLGKSYELENIDYSDQDKYLDKCWRKNIIVKQLDNTQLGKVVSYINFMTKTQNSRHLPRVFHLFFRYVRWYFPRVLKDTKSDSLVPTDQSGGLVEREVDIMMGTPLLLYLYTQYFIVLINDYKDTINWKKYSENSSLYVYEMFVVKKLQILFEDKNEMDGYKPDLIKKYMEGYLECLGFHKKLAAHTLFFHRIRLPELQHIHPFKNKDEYENVVKEIKCGIEKIGLITHVTADNIPVFIYKSLEEYFASEFLCDMIKNDNIDLSTKNILYSLAQMTLGILPWLTKKRSVDKILARKLDAVVRLRPSTVSVYGNLFATGWSMENLIRLRSSSEEDYEPGCFAQYNDDNYKALRRLQPEEKKKRTLEFQNNVIAKMKPHLRQYFTTFPSEEAGHSFNRSTSNNDLM